MARESLGSRLKHAWNAFLNRAPTHYENIGVGNYTRPDRIRLTGGAEKTIITSIYNRLALDVVSMQFLHVDLDENDRYKGTRKSDLNYCLNTEANLDQTSFAFLQDVVMSMFDEGVVAVVPVDTVGNPLLTDNYKIKTMRVGKIVEWYPKHVKVNLYNENTGLKEDLVLPKTDVAIIENPFYAVMNAPNSTLQRLKRKLNLLDVVDEQSSSGKLDLIIQLPYTVKSEARRQQADKRRQDIEMQLTGSKYGIAYTDSTEKITQLNRPLENNLMKQVEYLTSMLYSQLNITQSILDGTADEKTMVNYLVRTVKLIARAIVDEMKRKFLTKTARSQGQSIMFFRDVFELTDIASLAEAADKFTRNEILSKNEVRQRIGFVPSDDPKADQLINSNISQPQSSEPVKPVQTETYEEGGEIQNE